MNRNKPTDHSARHPFKLAAALSLVYLACLGLTKRDAERVFRIQREHILYEDEIGRISWSTVASLASSLQGEVIAPGRWSWRDFVNRLFDEVLNATSAMLLVGVTTFTLILTLGIGIEAPLVAAIGFASVTAVMRAAVRFRRIALRNAYPDFHTKWRKPVDRTWTIPNIMSGLRPVIAVLVGSQVMAHNLQLAFVGVVVLVMTDALDGPVARKLDQVTLLGERLDSGANRLSSAILLLIALTLPGLTGVLKGLAIAVVLRETIVLVAGFVLLADDRDLPKFTKIGKVAAIAIWLQILLIYYLPIASQPNYPHVQGITTTASAVAAALAWLSAIGYATAIWYRRHDRMRSRNMGPLRFSTDDPYTIEGVFKDLDASPLTSTLADAFQAAVEMHPTVQDPIDVVDRHIETTQCRATGQSGRREEALENLRQVRDHIERMRRE